MNLPILSRIRIDRHELSGSFGDIGTDLPLLVGMILASGMHPASVLVIFGLAQVVSALFYGIPMPVQPLKAVAALVIAGGISAPQVYGAGFSIGVIMLILTVTGLLERLRVIIPKSVIRGIQLGLGIKLAMLALLRYVPADGWQGLILAAICGVIVLVLAKSKRCPPALPVIAIGLVYAFSLKMGLNTWRQSFGFALPQMVAFTASDMIQGMVILALPQIPLSLGNSLFATHQMASDLFPERGVKLKTIGFTYSMFNMICPFFGGIPVCHGSGGMAGHYVFGGRTGGSVLIYGVMLLTFGAFFGSGFDRLVHVFPLPVLGVILATEGVVLMRFVRDIVPLRPQLLIALITAFCAVAFPYGFLIGLIAGTTLSHLPALRRGSKLGPESPRLQEVRNA